MSRCASTRRDQRSDFAAGLFHVGDRNSPIPKPMPSRDASERRGIERRMTREGHCVARPTKPPRAIGPHRYNRQEHFMALTPKDHDWMIASITFAQRLALTGGFAAAAAVVLHSKAYGSPSGLKDLALFSLSGTAMGCCILATYLFVDAWSIAHPTKLWQRWGLYLLLCLAVLGTATIVGFAGGFAKFQLQGTSACFIGKNPGLSSYACASNSFKMVRV
jgi:hypothetical protein